jgi:GrpB-like predicted nucleotidyltransferase (UPF0157 family)
MGEGPGMNDTNQQRTEEALQAPFVGGAAPSTGPIVLAEYDPEWPELYRREEQRIRAALGPAACLIEHVGSTSVPGLAAKPRIDIVLAVPDSAAEPAYLLPLERAGYVLCIREPGWNEHRMFKGPDTDVNLHVFSSGCPEVGRMIAFRDRLRTHPTDRARYEQLKRSLATRSWRFVQEYADAKTDLIRAILADTAGGR